MKNKKTFLAVYKDDTLIAKLDIKPFSHETDRVAVLSQIEKYDYYCFGHYDNGKAIITSRGILSGFDKCIVENSLEYAVKNHPMYTDKKLKQ